MWFIPGQCDDFIYINLSTHEINRLIIIDEKDLLNNNQQLIHGMRYSMHYIRYERYIGIFSHKTQREIEIDTISFKWKYVDYKTKTLDKILAGLCESNDYYVEEKKFPNLNSFVEALAINCR